jgi:hypothetical protein
MLDINSTVVQLKLDLLGQAVQGCQDAIVFGDIYIVEGSYTVKCIEFGCKRATLVDTVETCGWLDERKKNPKLNFYKGDFSNTLFMKSIPEKYDVSIAFDVLLHQPPLINTLELILEKTSRRICIFQPMLLEQENKNTLVYLPGSENADIHPMNQGVSSVNIFDIMEVNQSRWIWGITPSFMKNVLKGSGFDIIYEIDGGSLPNKKWFYWGCIAEKKATNDRHWANMGVCRDIIEPHW